MHRSAPCTTVHHDLCAPAPWCITVVVHRIAPCTTVRDRPCAPALRCIIATLHQGARCSTMCEPAANTVCFGLTGPISGERSHLQAPRGAYFEHLSNTSSTQVLDCSNTSSCQSNSHPYPGNPCLSLDVSPCAKLVEQAGRGPCRPAAACIHCQEGGSSLLRELDELAGG